VKTIYFRRGKSPEQRIVKIINCTLYINPGRTNAVERNIIEKSIGRFIIPNKEGIDVSITFDGEKFKMHEFFKRHKDTLIFSGQKTD
jgi:hypothetical protein